MSEVGQDPDRCPPGPQRRRALLVANRVGVPAAVEYVAIRIGIGVPVDDPVVPRAARERGIADRAALRYSVACATRVGP